MSSPKLVCIRRQIADQTRYNIDISIFLEEKTQIQQFLTTIFGFTDFLHVPTSDVYELLTKLATEWRRLHRETRGRRIVPQSLDNVLADDRLDRHGTIGQRYSGLCDCGLLHDGDP